ncbi:hypothetical protein ACIRBX_09975 [Kitasatospora sp. NPDC096147]|uniref:hypothetical protein n=1 Tax=Kitasatospora sp. NPDC096147 TaxID=3364093 RepID=UPI0038166E15
MSGSELLDHWWTWCAVAPFVLVGAVIRLAWRWGTTERPSAMLRLPGTVGLLAASVAGCTHLLGVLVMPWLDPGDACRRFAPDHPELVQHDFPLSAKCVARGAADGIELVPPWVHPVVVGGLLVAAVAFALAAVRCTVLTVRYLRTWHRDVAEQRWADAEEAHWQVVAGEPERGPRTPAGT